MNHYIEISILPDPEFPATVLMNAIYSKLHKALCDLGSSKIGVSFPKYGITLGNVLRLHGEEAALSDLQGMNWIGGMSGYCNFSDIFTIPLASKFRTVSRKQSTMSQAKLRRLIKRGSISLEDIEQYQAKIDSKMLAGPYVELVSGSNGQRHRRYIEFGELIDEPIQGEFDQFGLSKKATIPWFD